MLKMIDNTQLVTLHCTSVQNISKVLKVLYNVLIIMNNKVKLRLSAVGELDTL